MALKIVLLVAVVALCNSPALGQFGSLVGGFSPLPMGGYSETVGWQGKPLWGSLYQEHNFPRFPSPITYRGGADFTNPQGHGLAGSFSMQSGKGGEASLKGVFPIVNNPVHTVDGFSQVGRNLNANLNPIGPETNKFGVNYKHADGATASFSQTQTHGNPASKTIGASIPVVFAENHKVTVTGENNIGAQHSLGVKYENLGNGATASLTGTQNKVGPARGTVTASIPVGNVGPALVTVEGGSTFGHGMKPDSNVGLKVSIPLN